MARNGARRNLALDALLAGATVTAAAERAGVARRTLCRWVGDATFAGELAERQAEARRAAALRLGALFARALERAEKALGDAGPDGLRAALAVLRVFAPAVLRAAPPPAAGPGAPCNPEDLAPDPRFFGPDMPPDQRARILLGDRRANGGAP